MPYIEEDLVYKSWNCCSKGGSRTQYSSIFTLVPQKQSNESFTIPASMVVLQLLNLQLLKSVLKGEKYGVMIIKRGHLMTQNM
jgi:hypothetical protein